MADDPAHEFLNNIGGWEGFEVDSIRREADLKPDALGLPSERLVIALRAKPGVPKRCSRCGSAVTEIHDISERRVRDLPIWDLDTWLILPRARLQCPQCGPTVEALSWLDKHQRMTTRLAEKISRLAMVLPLSHVADWFQIHWTTAKLLHQRALEEKLGPMTRESLADVRRLSIDEFAIQKGHRYATVVVDADTKRVLWVNRGRDRAALSPFFDLLGPEGCARIEAIAMDMSGPFGEEVRERCPDAAIVYDLFHVVMKYGREVIDRVRVDETNKIARAQGPNRKLIRAERRVIKGTRWLLLKNRSNLRSPAERVRLDELLEANHALFIVYVLKDDLKQLWRYRYAGSARRFWQQWYRRAMASGIEPLKRFANQLKLYLPGIISHCRYPLSTALVEGINNKIKVIKRMAYGYRDDYYFFLRIRAAFPGNPR